MAACWRALAATYSDIELKIIAGKTGTLDATRPYDSAITQGLNIELLPKEELFDVERVAKIVSAHKPDVVFLPGWFNPAFNALPFRKELKSARFMLGVDNPLE